MATNFVSLPDSLITFLFGILHLQIFSSECLFSSEWVCFFSSSEGFQSFFRLFFLRGFLSFLFFLGFGFGLTVFFSCLVTFFLGLVPFRIPLSSDCTEFCGSQFKNVAFTPCLLRLNEVFSLFPAFFLFDFRCHLFFDSVANSFFFFF